MSETPLWDAHRSNEWLAYLLLPKGKVSQIGPEIGPTPATGVARWRDKFGGTRYVMFRKGVAVSAVQVMSKPDGVGLVANVYTLPTARRRGHGAALVQAAKRDFDSLVFSPDRSLDGAAWVSAVENAKTANPDTDLQALLRDVKDTPHDLNGWRVLLTRAWRSGMTVFGTVGEAPAGTVGGSLSVGDEVEVDFPIRSGNRVGLSVTKIGEVTSSMIYAHRLNGLRIAPQREGSPPGPGRVARRPNPDEDERVLERAAKLGDTRAQRKLDQARARRGVRKVLTWGVVPEYDEFLEHTSAMGVEWPLELSLNSADQRAVREALGVGQKFFGPPRARGIYAIPDAEMAHAVVIGLVNAADNVSGWVGHGWDVSEHDEQVLVEDLERIRSLASSIMEVCGYEWI